MVPFLENASTILKKLLPTSPYFLTMHIVHISDVPPPHYIISLYMQAIHISSHVNSSATSTVLHPPSHETCSIPPGIKLLIASPTGYLVGWKH